MARITTIERQCQNCKVTFETLDSRKKFCTRSCAASFNNRKHPKRKAAPKPESRGSVVERWLRGEHSGTVKAGLSVPIRLYLLEEAGYRCQSPTCAVPGGWSGINPVSGKTTLTVDHIDGRSDNNARDNLIVLCPCCHSLTPTYGALNKGNGRSARYNGVVAQSEERNVANVEVAGS